jgi:hypothetical protein
MCLVLLAPTGRARFPFLFTPPSTDLVMAYYQFKDESTGIGYGSCEVWFTCGSVDIGGDLEPGWYWQACFPGCLPDGEPEGPFPTEYAALADADAVPA